MSEVSNKRTTGRENYTRQETRERTSSNIQIKSSSSYRRGRRVPIRRHWYNLWGVIDTKKLQRNLSSSYTNPSAAYEVDIQPRESISPSDESKGRMKTISFEIENHPSIPRTTSSTQSIQRRLVDTRPNVHGPPDRQSPSNSHDGAKNEMTKTSDTLFYGSICNFIGGLLLLMSFSSPYWLQSWEETQSPFKNMGLWEMCFYKFRHPDYQFDHLFTGCHAIYGDEYRLIREKLLPGWLMVVQLFVTLSLIASFLAQIVIVGLLLRFPLEIILRFEWQFCIFTFVCNAFSALTSFLAIAIFGKECWSRTWLLYPNFNFVSWSYAFAVFATLIHIISSLFLYADSKAAKERKDKNKALIMQMQPPGFGSSSTYHAGGGYL